VVDNASVDGSAEMVEREFPLVTLIRNAQNVGFGAANNQALAAASGELILYLNSDAYAHENAIDRLAEVFGDPTVIAAGGMLLNIDGTLQQSTANELTLWAVFCEQTLLEKFFPKHRLLSPYWNTARLLDTYLPETPQVMGACLMTRRKDIRWDERYFLYCEDTDLCRRLRKFGRILYVADAIFTHELGTSSKDRSLAIARYNRGKEIYFRIHHGRVSAGVCWMFNRAGALLRLVASGCAALFRPSARTTARQWSKVLLAPISGPDAQRKRTSSASIPE
jgi:hypothetical protein